MATFEQKLSISVGSAATFALVNLPQVYQFTNSFIPGLYNTSTRCPTNLGLIVHAIVFFVVTFLSMGKPREKTYIKLKHTIYGSLIFFFISNPATFAFVSSVLGRQFADANGCPTLLGIFLHAAVYCAALVGVMYLPEANK